MQIFLSIRLELCCERPWFAIGTIIEGKILAFKSFCHRSGIVNNDLLLWGKNAFLCEFFVQGFIETLYTSLVLHRGVNSYLSINVKRVIFFWTANVGFDLENHCRLSIPLPQFRVRTSFSFFLFQRLKLFLHALVICLHMIKYPSARNVEEPVIFLLHTSTTVDHIRQTLVMALYPLRD